MGVSLNYIDLGRINYAEALEFQQILFDSMIARKRAHCGVQNTLLFCEHNPVLTIGKSGNEANLLVQEAMLKQMGIDLFHIQRGGDITYHGPGQITGYPLIDLESLGLGVKDYVYLIESIIIDFLAQYDIKGMRKKGATGVWLDVDDFKKTRKICAIGIRCSRYVSMHGFALNVNTNLDHFKLINPCGFTEFGVASMASELGEELDFEKIKEELSSFFIKRMTR